MPKSMILCGLALLYLGACGNDTAISSNREFAKTLLNQVTSGGEPAASQVTQAQIEQAKATLPGALLLIQLESRKASALMTEIERNGAVSTFATGTRQVIYLENNVLRGTRGLSDDLMSTQLGPLPRALSKAGSRTGTREMRFLNGASESYVLRMSCRYTGSETIIEHCTQTGGDLTITNSYKRDADGNIIQSRQWVSPGLGYIDIQRLK